MGFVLLAVILTEPSLLRLGQFISLEGQGALVSRVSDPYNLYIYPNYSHHKPTYQVSLNLQEGFVFENKASGPTLEAPGACLQQELEE